MTTQMQLKLAKYALATMIIVMGAYGYHHFFSSEFTPIASWMIVALFVVIEIVILLMTTVKFEDSAGYGKKFSFGLAAAFVLMWIISFVGIDQTIWSLVESKYHSVQQQKAAIEAKTHTKETLLQEKKELEKRVAIYRQQLNNVEKQIEASKKDLDKKYRLFNDTVYNNGLMCDTQDCLARKANAQNAVDVSKTILQEYMTNKKELLQKIKNTETKLAKIVDKIDQIVLEKERFSKQHSLALKNKQEESLLHVRIMDFFNIIFKNKIQTPERAYVILLSLAVYPIYILFVVFVAMNSPQNKKRRAKIQERKDQLAAKKEADKTRAYDAFMLIVAMLKKIVIYLVKTRKRKVAIKEVEVEKEVEVIKEVYKDGKEIVKVEVEVPHIIEKEVVVEKIVEKPVIEKEFVVIPADVDLNKLNEITGNQTKPITLDELLKNIRFDKKDLTLKPKASYDKHSAA